MAHLNGAGALCEVGQLLQQWRLPVLHLRYDARQEFTFWYDLRSILILRSRYIECRQCTGDSEPHSCVGKVFPGAYPYKLRVGFNQLL
jgi:hypothetical protein